MGWGRAGWGRVGWGRAGQGGVGQGRVGRGGAGWGRVEQGIQAGQARASRRSPRKHHARHTKFVSMSCG